MTDNKNFNASKHASYKIAMSLFFKTKMTKKEIAKNVGVSVNTITRWTKGAKRDCGYSGRHDGYNVAKELFNRGTITNKDIAKKSGASQNTITRWTKAWKSNHDYITFTTTEINDILLSVSKIKDTKLREVIINKLNQKGGLL